MKYLFKLIYTLCFFLFITELCCGQYSFERLYNSYNVNEEGDGCEILSSGFGIMGGILPCGNCVSGVDYLLLDTNGNILSQNSYYLTVFANPSILHKCIGDTIIVAGVIDNSMGNYDMFFKKLNNNGGLIWEKHFTADTIQTGIFPQSICNTIDSGYFIAFVENSVGIRFMKLNNFGDSLFTKKLGLPLYRGTIMTGLHDNGFAILGSHGLSANLSLTIIRLDINGDSLWFKDFPRDTIGVISKIIETKDYGFALLGNINDSIHHNPMCIFKFDSLANFQWSKKINTDYLENFYDIQNCSDSGFIVAGITLDHVASTSRGFLYRTNSNGDSLWFKEYEPSHPGGLKSVRQTSDKGFLAVGSYGQDVFVIKTDSMGNVASTLDVQQYQNENSLYVYPNPAKTFTTLSLPTGEINADVYLSDIEGRKLFERNIRGENNFNIDVSGFAKGMYLISVLANNNIYRSKLIVE